MLLGDMEEKQMLSNAKPGNNDVCMNVSCIEPGDEDCFLMCQSMMVQELSCSRLSGSEPSLFNTECEQY
jgi:hypothetical protein